MSLRSTVFAEIAAIAAEQEKRMPPITDDLVMLDTEFDSLCWWRGWRISPAPIRSARWTPPTCR